MDMISRNYQTYMELWVMVFDPNLINYNCLSFFTTFHVKYMVFYANSNAIIVLLRYSNQVKINWTNMDVIYKSHHNK